MGEALTNIYIERKERTVKPMNLFYSQCTANKIKGLFLALFFMKLFVSVVKSIRCCQSLDFFSDSTDTHPQNPKLTHLLGSHG